MKRFLYIIISVVLAASASAQEVIDTAQFVAIYDYECRTQNDEDAPVTDRMQVVVQVGRTVTKSMPRSAYMKTNESAEEEDVIMAEHHEAVMHMPTVWTDYPLGMTTVRDWIFPHEFEGSEPTPDIAWTLTDDTLTVSGYLCQQATATHRGVEWRVWYTEEIPSSAGPWKLRGLPGLIVKAEDSEGIHCFELYGTKNEVRGIGTLDHPELQKLSRKKLMEFKKKTLGNPRYAKEPTYYVAEEPDDFGEMRVNGVVYYSANHMLIPQKSHVYQPLEKE